MKLQYVLYQRSQYLRRLCIQVQASMQGINTLRNRPGLAMQSTLIYKQSTIVNGMNDHSTSELKVYFMTSCMLTAVCCNLIWEKEQFWK